MTMTRIYKLNGFNVISSLVLKVVCTGTNGSQVQINDELVTLNKNELVTLNDIPDH